jgi:ribosomal protein L37AE/L43A
MADTLEVAASGRSKCRGCGKQIAKGELRLGERLPNPFGEGEAVYWFHPLCAACMRPEPFLGALGRAAEPPPDAEWLRAAAEVGAAHRRLPRLARAERASSGRARCRHCRELVEKGAWRLVLQIFEEGRMGSAGFIHVACAEPYFELGAILDRIERLTPDLSAADLDEIRALLARPPLAKTRGGEAPALSKTTPGSAAEAKRKVV